MSAVDAASNLSNRRSNYGATLSTVMCKLYVGVPFTLESKATLYATVPFTARNKALPEDGPTWEADTLLMNGITSAPRSSSVYCNCPLMAPEVAVVEVTTVYQETRYKPVASPVLNRLDCGIG